MDVSQRGRIGNGARGEVLSALGEGYKSEVLP